MTNPIPQAAVDAAAERFDAGPGFCVRILARYALEAAMPHLRKQIAEDIRAMEADPFGTFSQRNPQAVRDRAALIAEGETK